MSNLSLIIISSAFFIFLFYYYYNGQHKNFVEKKYKKKVNKKRINFSGKVSSDSSFEADDNELKKIREKITFSEKEKFSSLEKMRMKIEDAYPDLPKQKLILFLVLGYVMIVFLLSIVTNFSFLFILFKSIIITFCIFNFTLNRTLKKRITLFLDNFNEALDVIARGVKSGYMLHDCFELISRDAHPVVAREFSYIVKDLRIGMNIVEVMNRFSTRIKLKEARFFAIIIIIQSKTGGNLANIILNLSAVLRKRKAILRKISIASQEAKSSASIMMGLPFALALLFYFMDPKFMDPLINTTTGNFVMAGCVIWVFMGAMMMRSMINFYK